MDEAAPTESPAFFIAQAVEMTRPRSFVETRLRLGETDLLPVASGATEDGEGFALRVGPTLGHHLLGVPVTARLGPCFTRQGSAAIPIRWEAANFGALLPVLDGTLLLSAVDEDRCRLGIEASYRVPLGELGELLNRAVLHRVAQSTIRSFLERLAEALSATPAADDTERGFPTLSWSDDGGAPASEVRRWSTTTQTVLDEHRSTRGNRRP